MAGVLSPLQLNAGAGLLQNQGIGPNAEFEAAITAYESTATISPLLATIETAATGNILNTPNLTALSTLGASTCPALGDSVPTGYANIVVGTNPAGYTGYLTTRANVELGSGDVSKFCQALSIAQGYAAQTNILINSAVNSQTYMGNTFTSTNSQITGDITSVNLATSAFATDLANLGNLIDLSNLTNLGSPIALVQQIVNIVGNVPILAVYFIAEGVPQSVVLQLNDPNISVTDSVQKLMYQSMVKITGDTLTQLLQVLGVTTVGINNLADLLNPVKLFPNSFQSLTTPTANGLRAIYINASGAVNTALATELPPYVTSSLV
jgi:hypothetical protein